MRSLPEVNARTAAVALAVVSVLAVLGVSAVAVAVAVRDDPAAPDPYAGWQVVEGAHASYRVPGSWTLHPAGERVSYRDRSGRAQARGVALSTYDRGDCGQGSRRPVAWAVLAQPVPARDVHAVAVAAARQWARGFGTGDGRTGRVGEPEPRRAVLADGMPAVSVTVEVDLPGAGSACGASRGQVTVVAAAGDGRTSLLVVARHRGSVAEEEHARLVRSLAPTVG